MFEYLREHARRRHRRANLVIRAASVVLCDGDELIDVVKNGQGVLNVSLSLDGVAAELVDAAHADRAPRQRRSHSTTSLEHGHRRAVGH